ncbi:MAG TPA: hypothetical protein VMF32_02440 [Xanthobacteraceae bacterium]|nr:hypothetical protein [Xanthobacteraceae bacterium]
MAQSKQAGSRASSAEIHIQLTMKIISGIAEPASAKMAIPFAILSPCGNYATVADIFGAPGDRMAKGCKLGVGR